MPSTCCLVHHQSRVISSFLSALSMTNSLNFNHIFKDLKKTLYYKGVFCTSLYAPHNSETEEDHTLRYSDCLIHHPDHGRLNSVNLLPESGTFSAWSTCLKGQYTSQRSSPRSDSACQKSSDGEAYHRSPSHLLFKSFVYKGSQSEKLP